MENENERYQLGFRVSGQGHFVSRLVVEIIGVTTWLLDVYLLSRPDPPGSTEKCIYIYIP